MELELNHPVFYELGDPQSQEESKEEEEEEDALSFCDLLIFNQNPQDPEFESDPTIPISPIVSPDLFEFYTVSKPSRPPTPAPWNDDVLSPKFTKRTRPAPPMTGNPLKTEALNKRSNSARLPAKGTSLYRTYCGSSKYHKTLFGLPKFPPEMDMAEIKRRQGRLAPKPMFPVVGDGELAIGSNSSRSREKGYWAVVRAVRGKTHLLSGLAKATFGCIPIV